MAQERMGEKSVAGNLVEDPRRITTPAGRELVTLRLAENQRRFNREAREWEDTGASFYDVAIDNERLGNNVESSLHKGDHVRVDGNYSVEPYVTNEGEPGLNRRIWANDVAASLRFDAVEIGAPEHERGPDVGVEAQQLAREQQVGVTSEAQQLQREAEESWAVAQQQQAQQPGQPGPSGG